MAHPLVGKQAQVVGADGKPGEKLWTISHAEDWRSPERMGAVTTYVVLGDVGEGTYYNMGRPMPLHEVVVHHPLRLDTNPPAPRTMMLMQCIDGPHNGKYWLAETYMTSDGPRMRVIPSPGQSEADARTELARREEIVRPR